MNCTQAIHHICENLDENINSRRCRSIRAHISSCTNCQAYLDSIKKTVALYKMLPTPRVPSMLHRQLMQVVRAAPATTRRRQRHTR